LGDTEAVDVGSVVAAEGWRLVRSEMLDRTGHGREAALAPSAKWEFVVRVDPRWSASDRWEAPFHGGDTTAVQALRIAHEVAHTFFYSEAVDGGAPRRAYPSTATEESFCDAFADALLVPPGAAAKATRAGADAVVRCARQYNAPVGAVLRQGGVMAVAGTVNGGAPEGAAVLCGLPATWGFPDWWPVEGVFPDEWAAVRRGISPSRQATFLIVGGSGERRPGTSVVLAA
jgi:hypothetical protein